MNLKKTKLFSVIGIFLLCFLFHSIYEWMPNTFTAILFPVNESIWEHLKLIFTSIIVYGIIDYIILNKFKIKYNNFIISLFISSIMSIPIFLIIYLPIYYKIGPKMILNILVMLLTIIVSQIISYYILKSKNCKIGNIISLIFIIISYIVMSYLIYNPIKCNLFFDPKSEKYGINNYNV